MRRERGGDDDKAHSFKVAQTITKDSHFDLRVSHPRLVESLRCLYVSLIVAL